MMSSNHKQRFSNSIVAFLNKFAVMIYLICIVELILGLNGSLLTILGIPIRYILLTISALFTVLLLILRQKIPARLREISFFFIIILIGIIWTYIGWINNDSLDAIKDGKNYLSIFFIYMLISGLYMMEVKPSLITKLTQSAIFTLFLLGFFIWYLAVLQQTNVIYVAQQLGINSDLILSANNPTGRVWFVTSIFFPLSTYLFVLKIKDMNLLTIIAYLAFFALSVISSGSRSIFFASTTMLLMGIIYKSFYGKNRILFSVSLVLTLMFFLGIFITSFSDPLSSSRLISNESNSLDVSNLVRDEQSQILLQEFLSSPLIGHGFGYSIVEYTRSEESPFAYELFIQAYIMKTGIFGGLLGVIFIFLVFFTPLRSKYQLSKYEKLIYVTYITLIVVQGSFNPFLDTLPGQFLLLTPLFLIILSRQSLYSSVRSLKRAF